MTMTPTTMRPGSGSVTRAAPGSGGLYDILALILDKGLVIDAYVRVSVVGIELLTIDLRVVIASVDTYLRFAEAVDRLYLHEQGGASLMDLSGSKGSNGSSSRRSTRELESGEDDDDSGRLRSGVEKVKQKVRRNGSDDDDDDRRSRRRRERDDDDYDDDDR